MNIKYIIVSLAIFLSSCVSSSKVEDVAHKQTETNTLVGKVSLSKLKNSEFKTVFATGYNNYRPDPSSIEKLKSIEENYSITVVLGTWCGDSKEQVPHFFKIINLIDYQKKVNIICVDRKKQAEGTNVSSLAIQRVPTFIFYRENKEIGRIIETPKVNLEKNMLTILSR